MDALPIHEETGQEFASTVAGKMHACGHDIHTTTLLGVAEVLTRPGAALGRRVVLVFQPAEEALGGAAAMVADGVLDGVDMALGFHNQPDMPVGRFGYVRGSTLAAADRFDLVVRGKSGHAAHPELARSTRSSPPAPSSAPAQTVVSREIDPLHAGGRYHRHDPWRHRAEHHPGDASSCAARCARCTANPATRRKPRCAVSPPGWTRCTAPPAR